MTPGDTLFHLLNGIFSAPIMSQVLRNRKSRKMQFPPSENSYSPLSFHAHSHILLEAFQFSNPVLFITKNLSKLNSRVDYQGKKMITHLATKINNHKSHLTSPSSAWIGSFLHYSTWEGIWNKEKPLRTQNQYSLVFTFIKDKDLAYCDCAFFLWHINLQRH